MHNFDCLKALADLLMFVLTVMEHEELTDNRLLYTILFSSCHLYVIPFQVKRKSYLYNVLSEHSIWSQSTAWSFCIKNELNTRIDQANERRKRRQQEQEQEDKKMTFNKLKMMANSKLKQVLSSKEEKHKEELKENSNLVYDILSQFITYFINFNLPFEQSSKLLSDLCGEFVTDPVKAHSLYTELRSSQRNPAKMFTDEETRVWSLQKRSKRLVQFGYTDVTLILGCTIKFIDND